MNTRIMPERIAKLMTEGKHHYDAGRVFKAVECLQEVLNLEYGNLEARSALISCYGLINEMPRLLGVLRDTADLYPSALPYTNAYLFCLNYFEVSRDAVFNEHKVLMSRVEDKILSPAIPSLRRKDGQKIRIGYVSGDFREHSCSYLTLPLLKLHDRNKFELFLYSNNPDNDHKTELFKTLGNWRDIRMIPDPELKELIKRDGIDILVDLSGHTIAGRISVFFHRPAPIQMSWYGYLNTIGTEAIQYRITDSYLSPQDAGNEKWYTERLTRIPRAFLYEPPAHVPSVATQPALRKGFFTFGALHNIKKVSDQTLDLWCEVLRRAPRSKLLVSTEFGGDIERVLGGRITARGISLDRIIMRKDEPIDKFFNFFEEIDLMLDTFPYTSGVSAMHGIWMGTPTLTITGDTELKRNCAAVNLSRNLGEFVAKDAEDFIGKAVWYESHAEKLSEFRKVCREQAVVDNEAVVRALETLYERLTAGEKM